MPWVFLLLATGAALTLIVVWYFLDRSTRRTATGGDGMPGKRRRSGRPGRAQPGRAELGRTAVEAMSATQLELAEEHAPPVGTPPPLDPLPPGYGVDEAVALVKDPYQLYVYWEFGGPGEAALAARIGPRFAATRRALRVHDLDAGALHQWWVDERHDHWWVEAQPGHRYVAEIGRAGPGGTWYPLARSPEVTTPGAPPGRSRQKMADPLRAPAAAGAGAGSGWSPGAVPGSPWGAWGARS